MNLEQIAPADTCSTLRTPLRRGMGASFRTHQLVQETPAELLFKPSIMLKLFAAVFVGLGVLGVPAGGATIFVAGEPFIGLIVLLSGVGSVWAGIRLYQVFNAPRGLNLRNNTVLLPTMEFFSKSNNPETLLFTDTKALQIVEKRIRSDRHNYNCYELNIVTNTGERYNLVDHADKKQMISDAKKLARYLSCDVIVEEL